jgi:dipeptidyl aminopeptidase/acylaminoacyl peptidase
LNIYEYDWSPNGRSFVASAAPGPGDNNWWIAQLYAMPAASGKMTPIYKPALPIAMPRWSPGGSTIAFIEGLTSASTDGPKFVVSFNPQDPRWRDSWRWKRSGNYYR